jgi:hypothetical protein
VSGFAPSSYLVRQESVYLLVCAAQHVPYRLLNDHAYGRMIPGSLAHQAELELGGNQDVEARLTQADVVVHSPEYVHVSGPT